MNKLKFKKISISFLMLSLIFSSLPPSLSFAAGLDLGEIKPIQVESDTQELMLPMPEETKPIPVVGDVDLGEGQIGEDGPLVDEDVIDVIKPDILEETPIDDLLKPLEELAGEKDASGVTPLDMYDNRDNSGLKPKNQTGQYNVDEFTGVFSYSYPIQLPKGRGGLEPNVVLNYNHRRTNVGSYLGFGWESSIPSIERENRTGVDNLYNENYFVLNGSQIVPISVDSNGYGTYGKLVESDFSKIEFSSTNKWIVTDKLGTVYTYGLSASARQDNPSDSSKIYKWMLEEVRDTNDNFVRYEYYKDSGQIYPKKIVYTGNGVSDGIFIVNFEPFATGMPTENNLFNSSYQTGFEVKTRYLLDRIDVKAENDLVTSYDLNLSLNTNQNKYLLDSITPTFYSEGQPFVKDQSEFDYSYQATTYAEGEGYDLPNNYHLGENIGTFSNKRDMFIDLNSDSFPDYIRTVCDSGNLSVNVWENNSHGAWATSSVYTQSIGSGFTCGALYGVRYSIPLSFAEMNGDHLIDMVTDTNIYYNNGSGWDAPVASSLPVSLFQSSGPGTPPMNVVMFSDMNRDGYDDIVYNYHPNNSTAKVDVYIKDPDTGNWNLDNDYNKQIVFNSSECMWAGDPFGFTDINNDGLLDVFYDYFCYYPGPYPESVNEGYAIYLNTGRGLELTTNYIAPIETMRYVWDSGSMEQQVDYLSDIDSDGIRDQGLYWRNKWTTVTGQWSQGSISLLGQEIFNTGVIGGYGYYDITIPVAVADFNGDQVQDTMHSWGSTDKVYYGQGTKLDILNQVNYQSGANFNIYYDYSTNEKDSSGNLLNPELPFDLYVAKEVVIDDGLDNLQGIQYQYESGKSESYPDKKIKDVYGFSKVSKNIAQALPDVDLGDGSDGAYVSNGNETWVTNKNFTSLHVQSGHTITVEPEVVIKVQGEAIIDGILYAKGKGFPGGGQVAWGGAPGQGPGGGGGGYGGVPNVTTCGGGGAGHLTEGERGNGCQTGYASGGPIYGNEELNPIIKGSGGGGAGDIYGVQGGWGGSGGGAIQVFADSIEVNGSIDVDANNGNDGQSMSGIYAGGGGGGSGGSVYIRAVETADIGSNLIHAKGGQAGSGGYFNNGGDGADGRIRVEAKNIIGSTDPVYYSLGYFDYSIDNGFDVNLQKIVNEYHTAKEDGLYLHGKLKSSGKYDKQGNLLSKQLSAWQSYDLDTNRKFVYQENQIHTQAHLLEEGPLQEYSSDANTIALYHMDGVVDGAVKKDNAQGNTAYDLVEHALVSDVGFNGEGDGAYRSLGDLRRLDTNIQDLGIGAFSIEGWIKYNGGKYLGNIVLGKKNYYDYGFYVEYNWSNSNIVFTSSNDKYNWTVISNRGSVKAGEWQHFAFVMDTNNAYIYIDGELEGQASVTATQNPVVHEQLYLLCYKVDCYGSGLYSMDEVRISNTARSASEIYNYYHNTQEPYYEISQAKENNYNFTNGNLETENSLGKVVANINSGQITNILAGDEKDTDYDYALNNTKHILSAPKNKIISDTSDSKEQSLYYDNLPLGEVDKVNLTKEDYIEQDVELNRNFNSYGLVVEEISPENATTTIAYDAFNLYPAEATNALNQTAYTQYNLFNGQVATSTSVTGAQTVNKYDAYGRIVEVKMSDPDSPTTLTTKQEINYNDSALPRYTEAKNYFDVSSYSTSREYYDGLGRVIQKKAQSATTGEYSTIDLIYDSQGRISQQSLPYITGSLVYSPSDLSKPVKAYTYDALDRVLTESTPVGVTSYEYNGWITIITDPNGNRKDLAKDAYGNLVEVKEYNNNGSNIYTTDYEYSLTNKLKKITDSAGNIRNFSYDALDNLQWQDMVHTPSVVNPAKIQYSYDKNGNVLTETSFKNDAISYVYDDLNRVLFEKLSGANQISYSYDQNDDIGQLSFADYGLGNSKTYDYDILGQLRTATTTIENEVFVLKYDYNLNGNIKEIEYPNGWKVAYGFNSIGQINSISLDKGQGPANIASNIIYNQNGQMIHLERANGVVTDYTYDSDEAFRLTNILTTSTSVTFQDLSYTYDNVGNITDIVDNSDTDLAKSVHYNYDDLNRLLSADVSYTNHPADDYTQTFEYSSIGNMTSNSSLGTMNYTNGQPHQLSSYGTRTFLYDNAGNMKGNQIDKFGWDWRNRLKSTYDIASENKTYYKYDHNNQRFLKYTEELVFIPPDPQESIAMESMMFGEEELDGAGGGTYELQRVKEDKYIEQYFEKDTVDNTKSHVYLNDIKLATVNNNEQPYYVLSDNLDSNSILIDNTGSLAQSSDYKPFGEVVYNNTITDLKNDYKFTGKESDEENALQYYGARYLDNQIAKFISVEPVMLVLYDGKKVKSISGQELNKILSDPQGLNSYSYSRNNPIILVDVDGNWWKELITRQQSWSSFQVELGQAANQLYNDSGTAKTIMDHPGYAGAAIGVGSGLAAYGVSAGVTAGLTQLGVLGTQTDKANKVLESGRGWSPGKAADSAKNLIEHFGKHASEIGVKNISQYYQKANDFVQNGYTNVFKEGADKVYYNVNNNLSAILDSNGAIKTFYRVENINKINSYLERISNIK